MQLMKLYEQTFPLLEQMRARKAEDAQVAALERGEDIAGVCLCVCDRLGLLFFSSFFLLLFFSLSLSFFFLLSFSSSSFGGEEVSPERV